MKWMKAKQGLEDISILLDIKEMLEEWALQTFDMFMMRRGRCLMCKGQCACLPLCGCVMRMGH